MRKRFMTIFLAMAMCLPVLAACNANHTTAETTEAQKSTDTGSPSIEVSTKSDSNITDNPTEAHTYTYNGNGVFSCECGHEINIDYFTYYDGKPKRHFGNVVTLKSEDNTEYYHITSPQLAANSNGTYDIHYLLDSADYPGTMSADDQTALKNSRYVAFKIRSDVLKFRTDSNITLNCGSIYTISGITDEVWATYILDMGSSGNDISSIIFSFAGNPSNTGYFDIDYFVANDNLAELLALVDTESVQYHDENGTKTLTNIDVCELKGVKHTYTDNGNGTHTVSDCSVCGAKNITEDHIYTYASEGENIEMKCVKCGATKGREVFMSFEKIDEVVYPYIDPVKEYLLAGAYADVSKFDYKQEKQPKGITIGWTIGNVSVDELYFEISTNEDFSNAHKINLSKYQSSVELKFLLKNTTYYIRLTARVGVLNESIIAKFATTDLGPRFLDVGGAFNNCRDLGGYLVNSKIVLQDMVFRGSTPDGTSPTTKSDFLTSEGKKYFNEITPIKTQIDLRGSSETNGRTISSFDHATYVPIPLTAYSACFEASQANYYKQVFQLLAVPENYPVYIHCAGGADRTGTVAALLLALLGVSKEEIIQDYVVTTFTPVCSSQEPRSIDRIMPVLNGLKNYAGNTLSEQCESYLKSIGITQKEIFTIKAIMFGEDPDGYVYTTDYGISAQSYYYNTSEQEDMRVNLNEDLPVLSFKIDNTPVTFTKDGTIVTVPFSVLAGLSDGNHTATLIFNETTKSEFVFSINVHDIAGELQVSGISLSGDYTYIEISSNSTIFNGIDYHFHTRSDSKFPLVKPNIMINGKTVAEINNKYDLSNYAWTSEPAILDSRHRVPVSILAYGHEMNLLVNTEWFNSYLSGKTLQITICAGFEFANNAQTYKVLSDVTYIYENGTWRRT